jgi:hypothetical protein
MACLGTLAKVEGLKRDFQSRALRVGVGRRCWFKSRARNYLQANRSLAFRFEILA